MTEVAFQVAGGGAARPSVGGKTTGANLAVAFNNAVPTTLALTDCISVLP